MPFNLSYNPWADEVAEDDESFDLSYDPWADEPVLGDKPFDLSYDPWADTAVKDRYTTYNDLLGKDGYIAQAADRGEISIGEEGDDRPGHFWQGLGSFISQVPSIATDVIPMTVYRAYRRGKDVTLEDETGIDRLIRKNIQERAKYKKLSEEERQKKWFRANIPFTNIGIDINLAQAEDVADSLGYSVVNAFATLLGRAVGRGVGATMGPAAPVTTPTLGVAAGFASGYYVASGATRDEFVERARDAYLKEVGGKVNAETEAGWQARYEMIKSDADWTGFWEAAPETVGNLLMFGIAKLPIKGLLAKAGFTGAVAKLKNKAVRKIGTELVNKVGIPAAKLMGMLTEETFTEALTTMKQSEIEYKNGMRDKPLSYLESIVEVLPTVLLTTPILGLGMGGAVKILEKTTGKIVEEKEPQKLKEIFTKMIDTLPREEVIAIRDRLAETTPDHPALKMFDKILEAKPEEKAPVPVKISPEEEVLEQPRAVHKKYVTKTLEAMDQEALWTLGREHGLTDAEMDDRSIDQVIDMVADRVAGITAPVVEGQGGGIDVLETIFSGIDKTFKPGTVTEAPADATRTQAQKLMSAMGGQLTFFEETGESILSTINGFHDPKSKRIFINTKAKNPVLRVLGHETWHRLKTKHSDLYENVKAAAETNETVFIDFMVKLNARRKGVGLKSLKINDLTEEYLADFAGEMFAKASFWKAINKSNPTFARKIANSLKKIIQDFRRIIAAKPELKKVKQPFENMDQVEKAMSEAFGEAFMREAAPVEAKKRPAEKAKKEPEIKNAKEFIAQAEKEIMHETGNLKRGGDVYNERAKDLPVAELEKIIDWTRTQSKYIHRFLGGNIDSILRSKLKAPKKPRTKPLAKEVPSKIRTMRGAIKSMGGINFLQFTGELKEMDTAVKYLSKKDGLPIDIMEKALKDDKWLYPEESLLDVLRDSKNLKRDRVTADLLEKREHELSEQERRAKKEMERVPEAPPEGEYKTIRAEDLPKGKKLTIIEGKSAEGWDVYVVKEKDPFSITLVDGQEIELKPLDKVQVLKAKKELKLDIKEPWEMTRAEWQKHEERGTWTDFEDTALGEARTKEKEAINRLRKAEAERKSLGEIESIRKVMDDREEALTRNRERRAADKTIDSLKRIASKTSYFAESLATHEGFVQRALTEGKKVPEEILRDYPELVKPEEYEGHIQKFKETEFKDSDEIMSFIENNFHDKVVTKPGKEPKLEIQAYHGTGTVFEEFDTGYIGTGEGATAFGWGLYFSSIEDIGRHYAEITGPPQFLLSGKPVDNRWINTAIRALMSDNIAVTIPNLEKRLKAISKESKELGKTEEVALVETALKNVQTFGAKIKGEKRQLYKTILHKGKKPGDYKWLDWYDEISKDTISALNKQWKADGREPYSGLSGLSGNNLYEILTKIEESKKEASLFLLRAGVDGIRYPTETLSGKLGKGFNYVVFDADAISIEDRVSFSLKGPELSPIGKQYMDAFLGKQGEEAPVARSRIRGLLYPWKYVTGKSLATGETIGEVLIRKMQDKYIHLKKLQKRLSPTTQLEDKIDVYLSEEVLSGRTTWQLDQFENNYVKPFLDKMLEIGIDVKDLDLYVYAAHAPERNTRIDEKNPDFREKGIPGSGMHTEVANTIIKKYKEKGMLEKLEGLAKILYKINTARVKLLLSAGLITKETHDTVLGTYKRYVPLRGKEGEPDFMGSGRGFSTPSTGLQRALGRKSFAQSPLAWSLGAVEETIVKINKNEVGKSLLGLIREYPDKDLWTIDEVTTKQKWDPEKGEVETVRVPAWAQKDILHVWENGKRRNVKIKDPLLEKALLNIGSEKMGAVVAALAKFNRYLAMVNTSLNPEFVLSNFVRDIQTAGINLTADQSSKLMRKVMKDVPKALRHAYRGYRGKPGIGEWGKWFKLYRSSGGSIGFFGLRGIDDKIKTIDAMIKRTKKGVLPSARRGISEVGGFISDVNSAVENGVRLASFKNAVESGLTPARAASLSKNLTVNFNRKGELGALMNSFYLFYNAGVQGTARVLQVMTSKTGRRIGAGIAGTAFMMTELNRMAGGDDEEDGRNYYDKIPNYVKERSIILMIPGTDGDYIKFPLPYGYNIFWVMGEQTNSALHSGKPVQGAINTLNAAVDAFNPMGGDSSLIRTLSPTLPDVLLDLYMNQNFAGYPIKPEQSQFGLPKPQSWLYWRSVSPISKYIAQKVNRITGGNPIRPGKIDVSPEVLDYLVGTFTGAAGAFINRSLNLPIDLLTGKERAIHKTPFQRVFMGEQTEFYTGGEYRKVTEEIKRRIEEKEEGLSAVAPELSSELKSRYKATEKNLRAARKRIKDIERSQLSAKRKKELVKEKRKQMSIRQKDIIKRFDQEIGGSPWELIDILTPRKARKKING